MEKLTTKKRLYELLESGYGLKITENTFEKAKNFLKSIENDYVEDYEKNKEKYIKLIKDFNTIYVLQDLDNENWEKIAIGRVLRHYIKICDNILNNIEKFNNLEKVKVKSIELFLETRKSYIQKKDIFIDKENNLVKSKYSFFEYEVLKLNN